MQYRPFIIGVRSVDPMVDYLTVDSRIIALDGSPTRPAPRKRIYGNAICVPRSSRALRNGFHYVYGRAGLGPETLMAFLPFL